MKSFLIGVATIVSTPLWLPVAWIYILGLGIYKVGEGVRGIFRDEPIKYRGLDK